jgi:putative phosphoesterase
MQIAIISDIHDNLWNLSAAIAAVQQADALLCCGDLCSPFVVDELAKFRGKVHIVFGNNDADLFRITSKASKYPNCTLHGELFQQSFEGRRFAMHHFDYVARPLAKSRDYDVVCFGHNHRFEISRTGDCLLINPGPIMGAEFSTGAWVNTASTFVVYDTAADSVRAFNIHPETRIVSAYAADLS